MSGVLAFCLAGAAGAGQSYLGLLGGAARIAGALGIETQASLLGVHIEDAAQDLVAFGADKVFCVDDPLLENFDADTYVGATEQVCRAVQPQLILMLGDDHGRAVAPRLAYRLGIGLVTDCTQIDVDGGSLSMLKPVYGGKAMARVVCRTSPAMATVRVQAMDPLPRDESRRGQVVPLREVSVDPAWRKAEVLECVKEEVKGMRLEDAEIVVSGGRGIGSAEEFAAVYDLARTLGAAVGASRAAVDEGWVPTGLQIGLTGKVIAPKLYVAIGISGASQHIAGVSNAKNVVAINTDPDAPIFRYARLGTAEDCKDLLPALGKALEEMLKE